MDSATRQLPNVLEQELVCVMKLRRRKQESSALNDDLGRPRKASLRAAGAAVLLQPPHTE